MDSTSGYRIATFNIQKFGRTSVTAKDDSDVRKDLDMIATIIVEKHIDIIAIQEITHKEALRELIKKVAKCWAKETAVIETKDAENLVRIGKNTQDIAGYIAGDWEGRWAKPKSKYGNDGTDEDDKITEGYAFLWNKRRIKLVTNYNGDSFEPRIGFNLKEKLLIRPPFIGRFMPLKARYEFRLINAHIAWEESRKALQQGCEVLQGKDLRERELEILLKTVYSSLAKKQYDVNLKDRHARPLSSYTLLLGDYNLNLPGIGTGARMDKNMATFVCGEDLKIITVNSDLTTLKKNSAEEAEDIGDTAVNLANNYDHFSYDQIKLEKHYVAEPEVSVIYAFENYAGQETKEETKYDLYKKKISDHLPVILDLDIRKKRNGG